MIRMIIGHIFGVFIPLFIMRNIGIISTESHGKAPVYLMLVALLGFLEYQLFRSIKIGSIYFRGQVDETDESRFNSCQFFYSILSGFIAVVLLQNIF